MKFKKKYLLIFIAIIFICFYFVFSNFKYESNVFPDGISINGVDCSGLTVKEAEKKITKEWNNKEFIVKSSNTAFKFDIPRTWSTKEILSPDEQLVKSMEEELISSKSNEKVLGTISDFGFTYDIEDNLNNILNKSKFEFFLIKVGLFSDNIRINMSISKIPDAFNKKINSLDIYNLTGKITKTKNAYINLESSNFDIVKEVYGNNINKELLTKEIVKYISNGKFSMNFIPEDFYVKPDILSTDKELLEKQSYLRELDIPSITYKMYCGNVEVNKVDILKMYGISEENLYDNFSIGELKVDEESVKNFVHELAQEYDTAWSDHTFNSAKQGKITVSGGDYGYFIDEDKETEKLISELKNKKDITREPKYSQEGYKNANDIGDSYVEIDLTYQTLWLYKDGKLIISMPVVTGNIYAGYDTPPGVYILKYKTMHVTLKGQNADGSDYASPVTYWMPFNGGIGMHDANWRSTFGGEIYKGGGSHGCVNMPPSKAGIVYDNIEAGYPIVVHY